MNEKNMNPEQIRLHQLHLKSERMRQEAHSASVYGSTVRKTEQPKRRETLRPIAKADPVRKKLVRQLYGAINKRIASSFGIELVSGNQIQYR